MKNQQDQGESLFARYDAENKTGVIIIEVSQVDSKDPKLESVTRVTPGSNLRVKYRFYLDCLSLSLSPQVIPAAGTFYQSKQWKPNSSVRGKMYKKSYDPSKS